MDTFVGRLAALGPRERAALARAVEARSRATGFMYTPSGRRPLPHPVALNPYVIEAARQPELARLVRLVFRLHLRLPELARSGQPAIARACPLEEGSRRWLDVLPKREAAKRALIRIDVGWRESGEPVLFETNATAVAGFFYHPAAVRVCEEVARRLGLLCALPVRSPELQDFFFRWVRAIAGPCARVGFVEEPPFGPGDTEMPAVARGLMSQGMRCAWGAPWEVQGDRGGFRLRGKRVDWLFRDLNYHELPTPGARRLAGFEALARSGRVVPSAAAEFDHKGMLELLTSEELPGLFSAAERRRLRAAIPWTRVLYPRRTEGPRGRAVELFEEARRWPERYVLKPNRGCGGEGVLFGREAGGRWEPALERAARRPGRWVLQERVEAPPRPMAVLRGGRLRVLSCYNSVGVFYGGAEPAYYGRVNPRPIVNVARGGAVAGVFLA